MIAVRDVDGLRIRHQCSQFLTGAGNIVVTAGLNGSGRVTQIAGGTLTTGSGEINVKAVNDVIFGANASRGAPSATMRLRFVQLWVEPAVRTLEHRYISDYRIQLLH